MTILYMTPYEELRQKIKTLLSSVFTPTYWTASKSYKENDLVQPTESNGSYYRCIKSGISGEIEPVWPTTFGTEITDGSVKWRQEEPVYILDTEPVDYSYPAVILDDIIHVSEQQRASGNQPAIELSVKIIVIGYQDQTKTYIQTRRQAYDILTQIQNIIRSYPTLDNFGVLRAVAGTYEIMDTLPVFYKIQQYWSVRLLVKQEV